MRGFWIDYEEHTIHTWPWCHYVSLLLHQIFQIPKINKMHRVHPHTFPSLFFTNCDLTYPPIEFYNSCMNGHGSWSWLGLDLVGLDSNFVSVKAVLVDWENLSYLKIKLRQLDCFFPQLTLQVLRWPGRLRTFNTKLVLKVKLKQQNQHSVLYLLLFALQQHHTHTQTWASCTA